MSPFETVIDNILLLLRLRQEIAEKPALQINMTLLPENRHELDTLLGTWMGVANQVSVNNACINHTVPEKFYTRSAVPVPSFGKASIF